MAVARVDELATTSLSQDCMVGGFPAEPRRPPVSKLVLG